MSVLGNIIWLICGGFFTGLGYIIGVTIVGTCGLWHPVHQAGRGHHDPVWDGDRPVGRWRRRATAGIQYHLAGALWFADRGSRWGIWSRPWCWASLSSGFRLPANI